MSKVPGSQWIVTGSTYQLSSCPPGYELISITQQCQHCFAGLYCIGGISSSAACPDGFFSLPGATSLNNCTPAIFVQVSIVLNIWQVDFTNYEQQKFLLALAYAAGIAVDSISIQSLAQSRRSTHGVLEVVTKLAAPDKASAAKIVSTLNQDTLNTHLQIQNLPSGILKSAAMIVPVEINSNQEAWIQGVSISAGICLILIGALAGYLSLRGKMESDEEKILRLKVSEIRHCLQIKPKDGFLLINERWLFWGRSSGIIYLRVSHLEAAARLALLHDFDIHQFDAFCLSLEGDDPFRPSNMLRKSLLQNWILDVCRELIRPDMGNVNEIVQSMTVSNPKTSHHAYTANDRFKFFLKKVVKARIWNDDYDEALFSRLKIIAKEYMDQLSKMCDLRCEKMADESGGRKLMLYGDLRDPGRRSVARHSTTL